MFAWDRIPVDENGDVANTFAASPDWTIEILSPDESQTKVTGNILHCLGHGSQMGWLIDPDERSLLVYPLARQPQLLQEPTQVLPVSDFVADFQLATDELFGWLKL